MTPNLHPRNLVKEKLSRDEVVASMTIRMVQSSTIAALAARCGYDSLYVDLEHCPFSLETTGDICVAAMGAGVTPFVRVPTISADFVSRTLDVGALGIIAPHVETAAAAEEVVRLCRFPPFGVRSEGGPMPHFGYRNPPPTESHRILNEVTSVVIMIESGTALEHIDEIAAVPGIDLLFIGSNDLCASLGITGQFDHPLLRDAFERTIATARRHGIHAGVGGLADRQDIVAQMVSKGARYVSIGADVSFLTTSASKAADFVHGLS